MLNSVLWPRSSIWAKYKYGKGAYMYIYLMVETYTRDSKGRYFDIYDFVVGSNVLWNIFSTQTSYVHVPIYGEHSLYTKAKQKRKIKYESK